MICESPAQKAKRRERDRRRAAMKRASMMPAEKAAHAEAMSAYQKRRRQAMTLDERRAARRRIYEKYHDDRYRAKSAEYMRTKRRTDVNFSIAERLRARIKSASRNAGAKKSAGTMLLTGCSAEDLRKWLESQFVENMNWDNRSKWHIDHVIPCSAFNLSDSQQQAVAFHYTNLRPVWGTQNLQKSDKVPLPQLKLFWTLDDISAARGRLSKQKA
jgi:hypothetical protein